MYISSIERRTLEDYIGEIEDYYNNPEINSENPSLLSIDIVRENCAFFGIYNNWRIIMDDDEELVKYSKELEEDLDVNRSGDLREVPIRQKELNRFGQIIQNRAIV